MTPLEGLYQIMQEIGPAIDQIDGVAEGPDGNTWAIEFDDESVVELLWNEPQQKLELAADLGRPDPAHELDVCRAALTYNSLHVETGDTLATDELGGQFALVATLDAARLDLQTIETALVNFAAKARVWRAAVAAGCLQDTGDDQDTSINADAVRV